MKTIKSNKYTIGLFIDSLLDNYQKNIWRGIVDKSEEYGLELFTFLGGKLQSDYYYFKQRNYVYNLFSDNKIDGLIILSSSLSQNISKSELRKFIEKFSSVPIINVGFSLDEYPSIVINNEESMRELVKHFVVFHKYKKIAYITGPKNNIESQKRLAIYKEVLIENNLEINENIIFEGDFLPQSAVKAVEQLVDNKKESFDALIASNDYMAIKALKELQLRGYKIPQDVAIGGFDNIPESIYCTPQLTTVNQSPYRIGRESVVKLYELLQGNEVDQKTEVTSKILVRYSCGCKGHTFDSFTYKKNIISNKFDNEDKFLDFYLSFTMFLIQDNLLKIIDNNIINNWAVQILRSIYKSIKFKNSSILLHKLEVIIHESTEDIIEIIVWNDILIKLYSFIKECDDDNNLEFINILLLKSIELVKAKYLKNDREMQFESYYKEWQSMNLFFRGIYQIKDLEDYILSEFVNINIPSVFVSFFEENKDKSSLKIAYRNSKNLKKKEDDEIFNSSDLFPQKYEDLNDNKNYIVMTLSQKEYIFGFILFEVGDTTGKIYEILTLQISGIFNQIFMFDKINEYTKTLEDKVKERTDKLNKANKKISENNKELMKLDRLKNDFIANLTHDFRSPLTAIYNIADLSLKTIEDKNEYYDNFEIIYNASLKLKYTIDRMLNLAKMNTDGIKVKITEINIVSFLEKIFNFYKSSLAYNGIKITNNYPQKEILIYSDMEKLEQILNNIILNAVKFVNKETGEIILDLKENEDSIIISVSDNGIGISKDKMQTIFYRFNETDNTTQKYQRGTGIGLAFSKQLIDFLKGKIWAESKGVNKGSTFFIELSKNVESTLKNSKSDSKNIEKSAISHKLKKINMEEVKCVINEEINKKIESGVIKESFKELNKEDEYDYLKGKILIIDDDKNIRRIIRSYLSNHGYKNFITAADGRQGIEAVYIYNPDIIISDFNMPNMRGDKFHDRLLSNPNFRSIPFIFLSAVDDNEIVFERREKGANAFLIKPIEERELILTVEYHLKNYFKHLKMLKLSNIDELVGLKNRRSIINDLKHELFVRKYRDLSVIFFDIDYFKDFNDKYGHQFGDMILKNIGKILNKNKRAYDILGRYGGDEFLIILPDTNINDTQKVAENIKNKITSHSLKIKSKKVNVSISMGISSLKDNSTKISQLLKVKNLKEIYDVKNPENADWDKIDKLKNEIADILIKLADDALYKAKQTKCSKCGFYSEKKIVFTNNKCPECGSGNLNIGRNRIMPYEKFN